MLIQTSVLTHSNKKKKSIEPIFCLSVQRLTKKYLTNNSKKSAKKDINETYLIATGGYDGVIMIWMAVSKKFDYDQEISKKTSKISENDTFQSNDQPNYKNEQPNYKNEKQNHKNEQSNYKNEQPNYKNEQLNKKQNHKNEQPNYKNEQLNEKQNHKNSIYKFTKNPLSVTHCQILNDHKGTVLCLELFLLNNTIHLISGGDDCSLIMYQYIKNDKFSNKKQVPENTQNEEIKKDDTSIEIKNETDSKIQDQTKKSELNDTPYNFKKITSSVLHKLDITAICMNLTPFFIITGSLDGSICLLNYKMNVLRRIKTEGGVKGLTFYSLSNDSPSDNLNTFTFQLNNKNDEKFLIFVKTDSHLQIFTFTFPNNILLTFNLFISPLQFESYFNKLRIIKDDHENILAVPGWINNKEDSVALFKISDILTEIQAVRENDNILRSKIIHLMGHPSTVECIAFYKNKIITGGQDGSLVVWGKDHNQSDEQTVNHTIDHNDINLSTKTDHKDSQLTQKSANAQSHSTDHKDSQLTQKSANAQSTKTDHKNSQLTQKSASAQSHNTEQRAASQPNDESICRKLEQTHEQIQRGQRLEHRPDQNLEQIQKGQRLEHRPDQNLEQIQKGQKQNQKSEDSVKEPPVSKNPQNIRYKFSDYFDSQGLNSIRKFSNTNQNNSKNGQMKSSMKRHMGKFPGIDKNIANSSIKFENPENYDQDKDRMAGGENSSDKNMEDGTKSTATSKENGKLKAQAEFLKLMSVVPDNNHLSNVGEYDLTNLKTTDSDNLRDNEKLQDNEKSRDNNLGDNEKSRDNDLRDNNNLQDNDKLRDNNNLQDNDKLRSTVVEKADQKSNSIIANSKLTDQNQQPTTNLEECTTVSTQAPEKSLPLAVSMYIEGKHEEIKSAEKSQSIQSQKIDPDIQKTESSQKTVEAVNKPAEQKFIEPSEAKQEKSRKSAGQKSQTAQSDVKSMEENKSVEQKPSEVKNNTTVEQIKPSEVEQIKPPLEQKTDCKLKSVKKPDTVINVRHSDNKILLLLKHLHTLPIIDLTVLDDKLLVTGFDGRVTVIILDELLEKRTERTIDDILVHSKRKIDILPFKKENEEITILFEKQKKYEAGDKNNIFDHKNDILDHKNNILDHKNDTIDHKNIQGNNTVRPLSIDEKITDTGCKPVILTVGQSTDSKTIGQPEKLITQSNASQSSKEHSNETQSNASQSSKTQSIKEHSNETQSIKIQSSKEHSNDKSKSTEHTVKQSNSQSGTNDTPVKRRRITPQRIDTDEKTEIKSNILTKNDSQNESQTVFDLKEDLPTVSLTQIKNLRTFLPSTSLTYRDWSVTIDSSSNSENHMMIIKRETFTGCRSLFNFTTDFSRKYSEENSCDYNLSISYKSEPLHSLFTNNLTAVYFNNNFILLSTYFLKSPTVIIRNISDGSLFVPFLSFDLRNAAISKKEVLLLSDDTFKYISRKKVISGSLPYDPECSKYKDNPECLKYKDNPECLKYKDDPMNSSKYKDNPMNSSKHKDDLESGPEFMNSKNIWNGQVKYGRITVYKSSKKIIYNWSKKLKCFVKNSDNPLDTLEQAVLLKERKKKVLKGLKRLFRLYVSHKEKKLAYTIQLRLKNILNYLLKCKKLRLDVIYFLESKRQFFDEKYFEKIIKKK